jgi:YD repeat-containing protein
VREKRGYIKIMKKTISKKIMLWVGIVIGGARFGYSFTPVHQQFGPQSQLLPIEQIEFARPKDMVNILPGRPIAARDKYGNRTYFSPSGHAMLRISNDGKREFSLGAYSKETDEKGKVLRETTKSQGTNLVELKNDKGEIVGYQELGLGGRVVREYDSEMNLTRSYHYNDYGKKIEYVVDELSQSRTVYDDKGRPVYDLDFEGNKMATYQYDEDGRLEVKTDAYGNKTYFDKKGNMTATYDSKGNLLVKYEYGTTPDGHTELVSIKDMLTNNVTHFKDGKQVNVTNAQGAVIRDYFWDGAKLVCTYDRETQETTWYNINGKAMYTTFNDIKVKEWLYFKGKLVGFYDARSKSVVIYQNEREDYILNGIDNVPNASNIQELYDKGIIKAWKLGIKLTKENVKYESFQELNKSDKPKENIEESSDIQQQESSSKLSEPPITRDPEQVPLPHRKYEPPVTIQPVPPTTKPPQQNEPPEVINPPVTNPPKEIKPPITIQPVPVFPEESKSKNEPTEIINTPKEINPSVTKPVEKIKHPKEIKPVPKPHKKIKNPKKQELIEKSNPPIEVQPIVQQEKKIQKSISQPKQENKSKNKKILNILPI